jgi:predicted NBD/HSP70 family sugar kinase
MKRKPKADDTYPDSRQRELLSVIYREGRVSRWGLHERTGIHPNVIGKDVGRLLAMGVVSEAQADRTKPGRPQTPVEIDPFRKHVIGLAIRPKTVEAGRLNLRGQLQGTLSTQKVTDAASIAPLARKLLATLISDDTLAVGISTPGFLDPQQHAILFNAFVHGRAPMTVQGVFDVAGEHHVIFENDIQALAARWMLTHMIDPSEDVLLVYLGDGLIGAAVLVEGRPNRGCLIGANELGHMRYFVDAPRCYCGQVGCLERIVSSEFLNAGNADAAGAPEAHSLRARVNDFDGKNVRLNEILKYAANGLANVVNFVRPNRLVLVSEFTRSPAFIEALTAQIKSLVLPEIVTRVRIDVWDQNDPFSAETAGWLALVGLYGQGWSRVCDTVKRKRASRTATT